MTRGGQVSECKFDACWTGGGDGCRLTSLAVDLTRRSLVNRNIQTRYKTRLTYTPRAIHSRNATCERRDGPLPPHPHKRRRKLGSALLWYLQGHLLLQDQLLLHQVGVTSRVVDNGSRLSLVVAHVAVELLKCHTRRKRGV